MADTKISALSAATALAGTEVVPVVQGGATKKATIDQILAPASGKGINFAAAGGDTLTIYNEGTFTPTIEGSTSAGTAAYVAQVGSYTRIGQVVHFQIYLVWNSGTGTGDLRVAGLPFQSAAGSLGFGGAFAPVLLSVGLTANNYCTGAYVLSGDTKMRFFQSPVGGGAASAIPYDAAGECMLVGSYFV